MGCFCSLINFLLAFTKQTDIATVEVFPSLAPSDVFTEHIAVVVLLYQEKMMYCV